MQRVLSSDLWTTIADTAKKAKRVQAAIAYVTQDYLNLKRGDVLIVDASDYTIRNGGTDAQLLSELQKRGVLIYNCTDLHAKVILLDETAVVGSANMSRSSNGLVEAAIISDQGSVTAGVASLIEQLKQQSPRLTQTELKELCKIEVTRRSSKIDDRKTKIGILGSQTWLVGLINYPITSSDEYEKWEQVAEELEEPDLEVMQFANSSTMARRCLEGDQIIQAWQPSTGIRIKVFHPVSVLRKTVVKRTTQFFFKSNWDLVIPFGRFQKLLKQVGYSCSITTSTQKLVPASVADAIEREWHR